ncbi:MAG TPA: cysteine--tRNA ligase [Methylomirabilota bacterium]|nr:cysteine--tRNA ligase [Methylomirabilota bacterium]
MDDTVKIDNTLSGTKEPFVPLVAGEVRMYVCGVTVYDLSHVGHARSAIVFDVIQRYLRWRGYRVTFVKNYTDIDDKIIRRANEQGVSAAEISERYIAEYDADMQALGVAAPDVAPRATAHIPQMIALIERLLAKGLAYVVDGDVYFEVRRFPPYGKLSRKNLDELLVGARVDVDERKRDPRDFALWKSTKPGEPSWPSPWGAGRPGWHIECSAMAMQYLGESFDIHGGGDDLIFPHHECEIAQAEGATSKVFARYWTYNGMVNFGKEKMSKSLGNTLTIRDILTRHHADALRLFLLGTHYRKPLEWAEERVQDSARALERFTRLLGEADRGHGPPADALPDDLRTFRTRFQAAMDDDFNTPQAIGVLFELSSALYDRLERAHQDPARRPAVAAGLAQLRELGGALGLFQRRVETAGPPPAVEALVAERTAARQARDFARADRLREEIHRLGWAVEDAPGGARVTRQAGQ